MTIENLHHLFIECEQKICTDTRKIEKNSIFFCLKGPNFNANELAEKAIEEGCRYAIVDEAKYANNKTIFYVNHVLDTLQDLATFHRKSLTIPIIGITGSNGKTTNKELIHAVLSKKYKTLATKGNLNNHIGVPITILSITREHEMAIIEMGANHQGEIDFLCRICRPDYGLITNIGKAHLEGFGGEEGVKKGKGELYKYIESSKGKLFVNADDPILMELAGVNEKITYGTNIHSNIIGESEQNSEFVEFKWAENKEDLKKHGMIKTHMFGHYNFINLLCAACIGNYFSVERKDIESALSYYIPEMNRSQVLKTSKNTLILDAYNANPSSMKAAIENFSLEKNIPQKLLILGDMFELGQYSEKEHEIIFNLVKEKQIKALFVGEHFHKLKKEVADFQFFTNTTELLEYLKEKKLRGYTILIKGSRGVKLESSIELL